MTTEVCVESEGAASDADATECCGSRQYSKSSTSTADTVTSPQSISDSCSSDFGGNVIFFDWDDTLFPTTHVCLHCPSLRQCLRNETLRPSFVVRPMDPEHPELIGTPFKECMQTAQSLLREAAALGQVCIVTMAGKGWIEACCRVLIPELLEDLLELRIKIVYARDTMPVCHARQAVKEGLSVAQVCKQRAMRWALREISRKVSHTAAGMSGVLSIGDSDAERLALQDVLLRCDSIDHDGFFRECYCKTLKLLERPRLDTLVAELQILTAWLQRVISLDGDIDLHFEDLAKHDHDVAVLSAGI